MTKQVGESFDAVRPKWNIRLTAIPQIIRKGATLDSSATCLEIPAIQKELPLDHGNCLLALMSFLPIVERELRVAARKRSTFWVRIVAALVALLIGMGFLVLSYMWSFGFTAVSLGKGLFATLTWLSLAAALGSGFFLTSDCLSEEKREGTIGFLFLTDLGGYDVVLGKLLATSVRGFFALLAVFPILAVTLLMGGVTGPQFWKTALALLNALFVSLSAGMFVSSVSRDSQKALTATLILLGVLVFGGPSADAFLGAFTPRGYEPWWSLGSPGYLFVAAGAWGTSLYWHSLLWNQVTTWALLGLACVFLRRTWQDKADERQSAPRKWLRWWRYGGSRYRESLRRKLIPLNPVLWLACRERWQRLMLWIITGLMVVAFAAYLITFDHTGPWYWWTYASEALLLALYVTVASQAGRFFMETRRSGLMELILATSLSEKQILQGQWRALIRLFGPALILFLAIHAGGRFLVEQESWRQFSSATTAPVQAPAPGSTNPPVSNSTMVTTSTTVVVSVSGGTVVAGSDGAGISPTFIAAVMGLVALITLVANLAALCWFGMWMGLTSKSFNIATLKTLGYVQIIPWLIVVFLSAFLLPLLFFSGLNKWLSNGGSNVMNWYPFIYSTLTTVMLLGKDLVFVLWSRNKLSSELRRRAGMSYAMASESLPRGQQTLVAPPLADAP